MKFSLGQDGVDVLLQVDVTTFSGVVYNSGAVASVPSSSPSKIAVILGVVFILAFFFLRGVLFLPAGILQVVVQGFYGVVLGRRGFLFHGLKINVDKVPLLRAGEVYRFGSVVMLVSPVQEPPYPSGQRLHIRQPEFQFPF